MHELVSSDIYSAVLDCTFKLLPSSLGGISRASSISHANLIIKASFSTDTAQINSLSGILANIRGSNSLILLEEPISCFQQDGFNEQIGLFHLHLLLSW